MDLVLDILWKFDQRQWATLYFQLLMFSESSSSSELGQSENLWWDEMNVRAGHEEEREHELHLSMVKPSQVEISIVARLTLDL